MPLIKFLATEADKAAVRQGEAEPDDLPDENYWARLEDQLLSPREQGDLEGRLDDPYVRRRVAEVVCRWKEPAEELAPSEAQRVISRTRVQWAIAASILVAAGVLLGAFLLLNRAPGYDTLLARAETYLQADRHDQARQVLDRLLDDPQLSTAQRREVERLYGQSHAEQAEQLLAHARYDAALREADGAIARGVVSPSLFLTKASAALGRPVEPTPPQLVSIPDKPQDEARALPEEAKRLEDVYQQAKLKLPASSFAYRELAYLYLEHGRYALARENAESWLKLEPESVECLNMRGVACSGLRDYETARASLDQSLGKCGSNERKVVLHRNLAEVCLADRSRPRVAEAVGHLARAREFCGEEPTGRRAILAELLAGDRLKGAQVAEAREMYAQTFLAEAREFADQGKPDQALQELTAAIQAGAVSKQLFLLKARIASGQEVQVAQADFPAVAPPSRAITSKALLDQQDRRLEDVYREAAKAMPNDPFGPRQLTYLYLDHGHLEQAAEAAAQWNRVDPKSVECLNLWGWLLFRQKRHAEAALKLGAALALATDPRVQAVLHYNIAEVRFDDDRENRFGEVLAHYERSLELDPSHAAAERARAQVRQMRDAWSVTPTSLPSY